MKAELSAHFSWSMPPYRTARPGMLCRPTKVAAANCQALFPVSSHLGEGTSIDLPLDVFCCDDAHNPRFPNVGPYERNQSSLRQEPCQPLRPIESLAKSEASPR